MKPLRLLWWALTDRWRCGCCGELHGHYCLRDCPDCATGRYKRTS